MQRRAKTAAEIVGRGNIKINFEPNAVSLTLTKLGAKALDMLPRLYHTDREKTQYPDALFQKPSSASTVLADVVQLAETLQGKLQVCYDQTYRQHGADAGGLPRGSCARCTARCCDPCPHVGRGRLVRTAAIPRAPASA